MIKLRFGSVFVALLVAAPMVANSEVSQETIDSISTPNSVETSIGTLKFIDGAPLPETAETVLNSPQFLRRLAASVVVAFQRLLATTYHS